jgi:hypothetical protein
MSHFVPAGPALSRIQYFLGRCGTFNWGVRNSETSAGSVEPCGSAFAEAMADKVWIAEWSEPRHRVSYQFNGRGGVGIRTLLHDKTQ